MEREVLRARDVVVVYDSDFGMSKGIVLHDQIDEYAVVSILTFNEGEKFYEPKYLIKIA